MEALQTTPGETQAAQLQSILDHAANDPGNPLLPDAGGDNFVADVQGTASQYGQLYQQNGQAAPQLTPAAYPVSNIPAGTPSGTTLPDGSLYLIVSDPPAPDPDAVTQLNQELDAEEAVWGNGQPDPSAGSGAPTTIGLSPGSDTGLSPSILDGSAPSASDDAAVPGSSAGGDSIGSGSGLPIDLPLPSILPTITAFGNQGEPGTVGQNLSGAGKYLANAEINNVVFATTHFSPFAPIASALISSGIVQVPQYAIQNNELGGAAVAEGATFLAGGLLGPVARILDGTGALAEDAAAQGLNAANTIGAARVAAAEVQADTINATNSGPAYLTPAQFAELPESGTINPNVIRFSQDSASPNFRPPFGSVDEFVDGLVDGSIDPSTVDPIRLVQYQDGVYTLDNRRLYAFQQAYSQAGLDIPYVTLDSIPSGQLFKFTTQNNGTSIVIRGGGQ